MQRSLLSYDKKHPMILPPSHHFTELVIRHYHEEDGHLGTNHVLSRTREKFWIMKGQSAVRKVLNKCVYCQRMQGASCSQYMSDLPESRVVPGRTPFYHTMVDYFGPLKVKRGRTELKRWGCVFTCLNTRAVHLEVVDSLDSSAFLIAFHKFADLRGRPTHLYSDNATTFVGADRELRTAVKNLKSASVSKSLANRDIQWHFSPPLAPHHNGAVERIIKDVKRILNAMNQSAFKESTLSAIFYGVARILNDRPLTPLSDDHRDYDCLTPNSILLGRTDVSAPSHKFLKADEYARSWRYVQRQLDIFWQRWSKEYIPSLQNRSKWLFEKPNVKVGDVVLLNEQSLHRGEWPKAIVKEVYPDRHGVVRRVLVRTPSGEYIRDVRKIYPLELS